LAWVNKDAELKVTKQCKFKFSISENYIDEVKVDVVPLHVHEGYNIHEERKPIPLDQVWEILHLQCTQRKKSKIPLVSVNQAKKLINLDRKFVLLFLITNR
jgi:hypothetical protein